MARRFRREIKDDLEVVTYVVTHENGAHRVEELVGHEGPYHAIGSLVDLEVEVRYYQSKDGQTQVTLRSTRRAGEF